MNIVVCLKQVPETAEADLRLAPDGRGVVMDGLPLQINESDNYALEQALLLVEEHGGQVTVVTLGPPSSDEVLRMGMAKGAGEAVRLSDAAFERGDAVASATALAAAVRGLEYDLVLTGCMSTDDGHTQVGVALAEVLGLPHAAYVVQMEMGDGEVVVGRELEGGIVEKVRMKMPCLLAIQTGINEPRYASIMGIAKASKRPIALKSAADLALDAAAVGEKGSRTRVVAFAYPPAGEAAELLDGTPAEASAKLAGVLKEKGFI
jgi:electron transfer flavoprotein beta subunit